MYYVFDLESQKEIYFSHTVPQRQALKTTYALKNGLGEELAANFGKLMDTLESKIIEGTRTLTIDNLTTIKHKF